MGKEPIFVRPLTDAERGELEASLREADAFAVRRAQIVLASARGETAGAIAPRVGFTGQTVCGVIHAYNARGLAALRAGSRRPHTCHGSRRHPLRRREVKDDYGGR